MIAIDVGLLPGASRALVGGVCGSAGRAARALKATRMPSQHAEWAHDFVASSWAIATTGRASD
jgi:hypothetical protein